MKKKAEGGGAGMIENLKAVEIEVNSRCNRSCSYCPVNILPYPAVPREMHDDTFVRLHEQLAEIGYSGRISYHFYNEPLLRKDLERLIRISKSIVPSAKVVLFTNGELLTQQRYETLRDAGVMYLVITAHDNRSHPVRPNQIVQFPNQLEFTNRGGMLVKLPAATAMHQNTPCFAASEMLVVTVTGDVVLCYEDARRENIFGNIRVQTLEEIWNSPRWGALRLSLEQGRREEAVDICRKCTNLAHRERGNSAYSEPFWQELGIAADFE